jgi:phytanoyl-CoA hydroxylase
MSVESQIAELRDRGYVVVPQGAAAAELGQLEKIARSQLSERAEPLEFEADLRYPGAPASRTAPGGETVRRLLAAYDRHPAFARWATAAWINDWLRTYFGESVCLSRAHHNCVMTKHPQYGSLTNWHRDFRYWSFERDDLVSAWLALGEEEAANGALWLVPGSHRQTLDADRFDDDKFFRLDRSDNERFIRSAESPRLSAGDVLFFHCNILHSAGQNFSNAVKLSLVYTYHGLSNRPKAGTRSSAKPEVRLESPPGSQVAEL